MMSLGGGIFAAYLMALAALSPCPPLLGSQSGVALVVSNCMSLLSGRGTKNKSFNFESAVYFTTELPRAKVVLFNCLVNSPHCVHDVSLSYNL